MGIHIEERLDRHTGMLIAIGAYFALTPRKKQKNRFAWTTEVQGLLHGTSPLCGWVL